LHWPAPPDWTDSRSTLAVKGGGLSTQQASCSCSCKFNTSGSPPLLRHSADRQLPFLTCCNRRLVPYRAALKASLLNRAVHTSSPTPRREHCAGFCDAVQGQGTKHSNCSQQGLDTLRTSRWARCNYHPEEHPNSTLPHTPKRARPGADRQAT
jgi:hypothetical protein